MGVRKEVEQNPSKVAATGQVSNQSSEGSPASKLNITLFCVGTFFFWAALYIYVPVLSVYAKEMGASLALAGLVISGYGLTQLLFRVPIGVTSDIIGRRKPFVLLGILSVGLGCVGLVLSTGPWGLVISRILIGLGASMWVAFTVMFAGYFPLGRTTHAMGMISFISYAAQSLAGLVGGILSQAWGPVSTFYVGIGLAGLGGLVLLPVREEVQSRPSRMSANRLMSIASKPALLVASGIAIVNTFANFTTTLSFTPIYARGLGANDSELGFLYTSAVVATTIASLLGARFADRLGDRGVIILGMMMTAVACAAVPFTGNLIALGITQAIAGFGRGVCNPTLMSLSIRSLPAHERASGMGVFQAVYSIGMFVGPPLGGAVADILGLPSVFLLTAVLCLGAAVWGKLTPALGQAETEHA